MYTEFFELKEKPFAIEPNARFIVLSDDQKEALATLVYAIEEQEGWALLLGDPGIGKTTMIKALLQHLADQVIPAVITNPRLEPLDFMNSLALELGLPGPFTSKGPFLVALKNLISRCRLEKRVLLVLVDEAQSLPPEMLEEIRLLGNIDDGSPRVLNIFLVAQPELLRNLKKAGAKALMQRFRRYHLLKPLNAEETALYVQHRLEVAGATYTIFSDAALDAVYEVSGGNPRLINAVCDDAMLAGMVQGQNSIDPDLVRMAATDDPSLDWPPVDEEEEQPAAPAKPVARPAAQPVAQAIPQAAAETAPPAQAAAQEEAPPPDPAWPDALFEEARPDQPEDSDLDEEALSRLDRDLGELVEEAEPKKKRWFGGFGKKKKAREEDLEDRAAFEQALADDDSTPAPAEAAAPPRELAEQPDRAAPAEEEIDLDELYEEYGGAEGEDKKKGLFSRLTAGMGKAAPGSVWKRAVALALVLCILVGGYFLGVRYWRPLAMRLGLSGPALLLPEDNLNPTVQAQGQVQDKAEGPPDWGPTLHPSSADGVAKGGLNG